jgi:hypothetical protein
MSLKVGDEVKFLDATGGGVITKILDPRMVLVAIEGGFEIPTLTSNLLKMDTNEAGQRFFNESFRVQAVEQEEQSEPATDENIFLLADKITRNRKAEEIFLAYVPRDQKWLITGLVDIYLINNTSYDVLYNYYKREEQGFSGADYGSLMADSRLLLSTVDRENLPDWIDGCLQLLFHKERCQVVPAPYNAEFEIQGKKFYSDGSYRESPLIEGKGIVLRIASLDNQLRGKREEKKSEAVAGKMKADESILKHQVSDKEAEVDLHLEALTDSGSSMDPGEILEYQKRYFEQTLRSAIDNKFRKVTYIHGVGEGILRDAIVEILNKYGIIDVQDAPAQKYGAGALEIRLPFNMKRNI